MSHLTPDGLARMRASKIGNQYAKGLKRSRATRLKISLAKKGKPGHSKGVPRPPEVRAKIARGLKGHYVSPKARENLRVAQKVIELFRPEVLERKRAISSAKAKLQNQDPEFRARSAAGIKAYWERVRAKKAKKRRRTPNAEPQQEAA